MRALSLFVIAIATLFSCKSGVSEVNQPELFPGYNSAMYTDVYAAAAGVGKPFLLQQGYFKNDDIIVAFDTILVKAGTTDSFITYECYINPPDSAGGQFYFVNSSTYASYGITNFAPIWPTQMPNGFYMGNARTYNATFDCVGFGTRVLSVVGDTSATGNAYRNLQGMIRPVGTAPFAGRGDVATAYSFAVAFPTIQPGNSWQYICGGIQLDSINHYDSLIVQKNGKTILPYNGQAKPWLDSAKAGDILAFGYGPSAKDNGHFMVMARTPGIMGLDSLQYFMPSKDSAELQGMLDSFTVFAVGVIDCSGKDSHFRDSRSMRSGIGHGTLMLLTDKATHTPQGFIFGPNDKGNSAEIKQGMVGQGVYAISVGRWVGNIGR